MLNEIIKAGVGLFRTTTDQIIASILKSEIDRLLAGVGSAKAIELDLANKSAVLTLAMDGEEHPVVVRVDRYSIEPEPGGCSLLVHEFSSPSHPWLVNLARKFAPEIRFPIPVSPTIARLIL